MERNYCIYLKGLKLDCILYPSKGPQSEMGKFCYVILKHKYIGTGPGVSSIVLGQVALPRVCMVMGPRSSGSPGRGPDLVPEFVRPEGPAVSLGTWLP